MIYGRMGNTSQKASSRISLSTFTIRIKVQILTNHSVINLCFFFLSSLSLRLRHNSHSKWHEKKENLPDYCLILMKNVFGDETVVYGL